MKTKRIIGTFIGLMVVLSSCNGNTLRKSEPTTTTEKAAVEQATQNEKNFADQPTITQKPTEFQPTETAEPAPEPGTEMDPTMVVTPVNEESLTQLTGNETQEATEPTTEDHLTRSVKSTTFFSLVEPSTQILFTTSEDGRHLAYFDEVYNQEGGDIQYLLGLDGKALNIPTGTLFCDPPILSADGEMVAYTCADDDRSYLYMDGEPIGGPYPNVSDLVLSRDGERLAYTVLSDSVYLDGKAVGEGWNPAFSPDGARFAFAARQVNGQHVAMVDGVAGPPYYNIEKFVFSPDSQHIAYRAKTGQFASVEIVVLDGEEIGSPHGSVRALTFSDNGQHFAHLGIDGESAASGEISVYLDGEQLAGPFNALDAGFALAFSPNGEKLAYVAENLVQVYAGREPETEFPAYGEARSLVFSPNGDQLAYLAYDPENDDRLVVIDGEIIDRHTGSLSGLTFSPDGKHLVYVVNEQRQFDIEENDPVMFWAGPNSFGLWYVVVDGIVGDYYNGIYIPDSGFVFDNESQFHYFALQPPSLGDDEWHLIHIEESLD